MSKLSPGEETRAAASAPTRISDTQLRIDPRETYLTDSASEDNSSSEYQPDDEPTLLNPKTADEENQPPNEVRDRTLDTQTFGTTAATGPAAETTHPHEE